MTYPKPLPVLEGLTAEFYAWCKKGELRFQRCSGCGAWRHVPRPMCANCSSLDWTWERSTGRGRIFTWTVTAAPLHPGFKDATPYAPVVVESSFIPSSTGDEAGTLGGLRSGTFCGPVRFKTASAKVYAKGKRVVLLGAITTHNAENAVGQHVVASQTKVRVAF